ncbi:hypothetical protein FIV42_10955 [Persicimonas caeni]|uniref:Uncharacterized protein n=1 Tax=Persicimonas caeni TaxID=2292766 RepID=A0A4Y6PSX8_PERCE|nr:hypothetical protein [Persicimonas caeni]QDG51239.1 hypothetical protein FIV42_10955 [Persicimonas caeni]QED32460.1 hypothetical protein FRD00_10950 [Persicimonas caeni]
MAPQGLSREQCLLLQRHYDGELSAAESVQAKQLLERSASARVYVRALEELTHSVRAASELAWEDAESAMPAPTVLTELAVSAGDPTQAPLEELAPLLERFHDGEADEAEMAFVTALLDEREDAVDYLAGLDEIGHGLRVAGEELAEDVDFDGFWDGIAAQIGADTSGAGTAGADSAPTDEVAFEREAHLVLLQRYVDDEVSCEEAARVERWLDEGNAEVKAHLDVLAELHLGVNVAIETACEEADLRGIWTGVEAAIAEDAADAEVVSLDSARADRRSGSRGTSSTSWFSEYRQAIVGGLAAAVVLAGLVGLFKDQIFGPQERVIVEKRVVVVEQVEYSPGSSVMIDSPMKQASAESDGEEDPTVIWLFDSGDEASADEAPAEQDEAAPAEGEQGDEAPGTDAGTDAAPKGQPI